MARVRRKMEMAAAAMAAVLLSGCALSVVGGTKDQVVADRAACQGHAASSWGDGAVGALFLPADFVFAAQLEARYRQCMRTKGWMPTGANQWTWVGAPPSRGLRPLKAGETVAERTKDDFYACRFELGQPIEMTSLSEDGEIQWRVRSNEENQPMAACMARRGHPAVGPGNPSTSWPGGVSPAGTVFPDAAEAGK